MRDFSVIPSIEQLRQRPAIRALDARFGVDAVVDAVRAAAAKVRERIAAGDASLTAQSVVVERIESDAALRLETAFRPSLTPVINATGVVIHTNLGRAPLAASAIANIAAIARGYSSLEYDVASGGRGRRDVHAEGLLRTLTGAEAAVVVNNNAAATMIVLASLAAGREVIVSRGELVEIGGGFRVPEIMAQSGAVLREVGTTNKTRAADYAAAITENTALILRVHPSNFRVEGFTERPALEDLVAVGKACNVPVAEDLGSGNISSPSPLPSPSYLAAKSERSHQSQTASPSYLGDPTIGQSMAAGIDVCCFSGDKLLGGPQAGIIVGKAALVDRIRRHPLMRALRVDKMTYAALEATLVEYAAGRARETVPVPRMLALTVDEIRPRADALAAALEQIAGLHVEIVPGVSAVGGGSAPGVELPTCLLSVARDGTTPDAFERKLRALTPPVIARIERDRLLFDLRTVLPEQDSALATALAAL